MTQQEAIQWLIDNNATLNLVNINEYTFFRIAVKNRVFHVSVFLKEDSMKFDFPSAVTFFNS